MVILGQRRRECLVCVQASRNDDQLVLKKAVAKQALFEPFPSFSRSVSGQGFRNPRVIMRRRIILSIHPAIRWNSELAFNDY
jgi:hypothetical protein